MRKIKLTRKASHDLEDILEYTERTHGRRQRKKYSKQLESRLKDLARNPEFGRPCDHVRAEYRYYLEGKHYLFYIPSKEAITVIRILHSRMNYQEILAT